MSASPPTRRRNSPRRRWLRRVSLAGMASGLLGVVGLAVPMIAHGQANNLLAYGATGTGWAIQPYIENDEFLTIPATDQSAPYVYVAIDNNPSADAKAAYFTPGTAINAGLSQVATSGGPSYVVPSGVEARYPGSGTANGSVGTASDGVATQVGAGVQQAQASEAYAQAQAALASYQFAPPPGLTPSGPPTVPTLPAVPGVPTLPAVNATPTATATTSSGGTGSGATATPTPTPTSGVCVPLICSTPSSAAQRASAPVRGGYLAEYVSTAPASPVRLPDVIELNLANALKAAELSNPNLLALAGGTLPAPNPALPYASADASAQAVTKADDSGTQMTIVVHLTHVQLFQGIITFASIDSTLQAIAPASAAQGAGKITTTFTGATIGGIPVTFDASGIQVAGQGGQSAAVLQTLTDALNGALKNANIQIAPFKGTTMSDVGKWQGSGGGLDVLGTFDPAPGKVPATHVDFSLGRVTGSLYAVPNDQTSSDNGGFFGGFFGGCCDNNSSSSTTINNAPARHGGVLTLPYTLTPGELLALLFIVQGFSTAAVATAASNAETLARLSTQPPEEESR